MPQIMLRKTRIHKLVSLFTVFTYLSAISPWATKFAMPTSTRLMIEASNFYQNSIPSSSMAETY